MAAERDPAIALLCVFISALLKGAAIGRCKIFHFLFVAIAQLSASPLTDSLTSRLYGGRLTPLNVPDANVPIGRGTVLHLDMAAAFRMIALWVPGEPRGGSSGFQHNSFHIRERGVRKIVPRDLVSAT